MTLEINLTPHNVLLALALFWVVAALLGAAWSAVEGSRERNGAQTVISVIAAVAFVVALIVVWEAFE